MRASRFYHLADFLEPNLGQHWSKMDLVESMVVALDETASKRGHSYVTVFIDLDRTSKSRSSSLPPARARARARARVAWSCFAVSCVSMAVITTISPRWSATCSQPS
ncbi:hypothetical protein DFAR_2590034 [Desulfarculales bacterium]